jgi:hypothetical protein
MSLTDLLRITASPEGVMLAGQFATLLFVSAGLLFMFGLRRVPKGLMIAATVIMVLPFIVSLNYNEIQWVIDSTPRWVIIPLTGVSTAILGCWILWGVIALCFGKKIASIVVADILSWSIKGVILAAVAPYRGISSMLRRVAPRDSSD